MSNINTITIEPFIGFDKILLGQYEDDVINLIGKPNNVQIVKHADDSTNKIMEYYDLGVQLTFTSEDNYQLTSITFEHLNTKLLDSELIGLTEIEFISRIKSLGINDIVLESDFKELNTKDYYSEQFGLSFWVLDEKLNSITMFTRYTEDNETIIWPTN